MCKLWHNGNIFMSLLVFHIAYSFGSHIERVHLHTTDIYTQIEKNPCHSTLSLFIDCTVRLGIAQLTNEFGHGFNLGEGPPCRRRGLCARELRWCFPWTSSGSPSGGYSVASQDPSSMENQCSTIQVYSGQN